LLNWRILVAAGELAPIAVIIPSAGSLPVSSTGICSSPTLRGRLARGRIKSAKVWSSSPGGDTRRRLVGVVGTPVYSTWSARRFRRRTVDFTTATLSDSVFCRTSPAAADVEVSATLSLMIRCEDCFARDRWFWNHVYINTTITKTTVRDI